MRSRRSVVFPTPGGESNKVEGSSRPGASWGSSGSATPAMARGTRKASDVT